MNVDSSGIKDILKNYKTIAVYGLSPDVSKPSHSVPFFMKSKGYEIVGIYPRGDRIDDVKLYRTLAEVPKDKRKFLNVFRRPEHIPDLVEEVLAAGGIEVLWLQLGIAHPEAEKKAEAAGIKVVSNRCLYIEYNKHR